jgi:hypothetical protein
MTVVNPLSITRPPAVKASQRGRPTGSDLACGGTGLPATDSSVDARILLREVHQATDDLTEIGVRLGRKSPDEFDLFKGEVHRHAPSLLFRLGYKLHPGSDPPMSSFSFAESSGSWTLAGDSYEAATSGVEHAWLDYSSVSNGGVLDMAHASRCPLLGRK